MVMPERLPTPLASSPEVPALTASAAGVVARPLAASPEFTALPKRCSFTANYKLQILAETDRATDTGGISAILRREGLLFLGLERLAGSARRWHLGGIAAPPARSAKGCGEPFAGRTGQGQSRECRFAPHLSRAVWIRRKRSSPSKKVAALLDEMEQASERRGTS